LNLRVPLGEQNMGCCCRRRSSLVVFTERTEATVLPEFLELKVQWLYRIPFGHRHPAVSEDVLSHLGHVVAPLSSRLASTQNTQQDTAAQFFHKRYPSRPGKLLMQSFPFFVIADLPAGVR